MSYSDGEELIKQQIEATPGFSVGNVSRGDFKVIHNEMSFKSAVIVPGEFERVFSGMGGKTAENRWQTTVKVYERYQDDGVASENLQASVFEIIRRFDEYRLLEDRNSVVQDAIVRRGSEVLEVIPPGANGPTHLVQNLTIDWKEEETITLQE